MILRNFRFNLHFCGSCFVGVDVGFIPLWPDFNKFSAKGLASLVEPLSLPASIDGCSVPVNDGKETILTDPIVSFPGAIFVLESFEFSVGVADSKLIFWENEVSIEVFSLEPELTGGDCDRCDGESGAVIESSSAFDMMPCA